MNSRIVILRVVRMGVELWLKCTVVVRHVCGDVHDGKDRGLRMGKVR